MLKLVYYSKCRKVLKYVCGPLKKSVKNCLVFFLKNKEKNVEEGVQLEEMMRVDFYTHVRESLMLCICCCSSSLLLKVALIFDWRHFFQPLLLLQGDQASLRSEN